MKDDALDRTRTLAARRGPCILFALAWAIAFAVFPARVLAQPTESSPLCQEPATGKGLNLGLAAGLFVPPTGGRLGFATAGDLGYGMALGAAIVAPGARVLGLFAPYTIGVVGLGTLRVSVPLDILVGHIKLGVGPGYHTEPSDVGVAYQAALGLTVPVRSFITLGLEASYLGIGKNDLRALLLGPLVRVAL